jgi:hypothetical protein
MATLTNEQIEQKKQRLHQLAVEAQAICKELVEAGAIELSDDDLDKVAGGSLPQPNFRIPRDPDRNFYKDPTIYHE